MTEKEILALEVGPEIDRMVGEVIGAFVEPHPNVGNTIKRDGVFDNWNPSTDWNDAMWAAEQAAFPFSICKTWSIRSIRDLVSAWWGGRTFQVGRDCTPQWFVCSISTGFMDVDIRGHNGPLAICKAILIIQGRENATL